MTDGAQEYKPKFLAKVHTVAAGLMIVGSPFAAFYSFGAAFMFFLVGFLWLFLVGFSQLEAKKQFEKDKAQKLNKASNA